mgnify:CR=1 FL=1
MNDTPAKEIRFGPNNDYIKATVWENKTEKGQTYHSVKLSRCYRDNEGWHDNQNLFAHHLPLAGLAGDKAFEFIHEKAAELRDKQSGEEKEEEKAEKPSPATKRGRKKTHVEKVEEERKPAAKNK